MAKETISYSDALHEIEDTLARMEEGSLDVDELAEKVNRVTHLLKACREKLFRTEEKINKILEENDDEGSDV